MKRITGLTGTIRQRWAEAAPRFRLTVGIVLIAVVGLTGLTPNTLFGQALIWPYAGMVAAAGWGKSGLAFSPMVALVVFGLAQDVSIGSPIGCFALVNVLIFGASAGLNQTFDLERSPTLAIAGPIVVITLGFVLVWLLASLSGGHVARLTPLLGALVSTMMMHAVAGAVFDLGLRRGYGAGGMA